MSKVLAGRYVTNFTSVKDQSSAGTQHMQEASTVKGSQVANDVKVLRLKSSCQSELTLLIKMGLWFDSVFGRRFLCSYKGPCKMDGLTTSPKGGGRFIAISNICIKVAK